ncbi:MAG: hypothetical protein SAL70_08250 [Scytonema sp. PMC 1070.18]|nr:hypothetical protein [Scytonema sp. PMC 1070.18]
MYRFSTLGDRWRQGFEREQHDFVKAICCNWTGFLLQKWYL